MQFTPDNNVVKRCLQGLGMEEKGRVEDAGQLFLQAWNEATYDFEKFISAYHVARYQDDAADRLEWLETTLKFGLRIGDDSVRSAFPALYSGVAKCQEELNQPEKAKEAYELAASFKGQPSDGGPFYHGTKADLKAGDFLVPGGTSNYQPDLEMNHIYFTAILYGAGLAAGLAKGDRPERVYVVVPTGEFENDPNVTDKKFPGNPTRSYRSLAPLEIVGEVTDWARQTPDELQKWREKLAIKSDQIIN